MNKILIFCKRKGLTWVIISYILIITGAIGMLMPFLWMVSTSLKDINQVFIIPPKWIPEPIHWENYKKVFELINFGRYYWNTILVTTGRMAGMFIACTLAAYAFARLKFPGRDILFFLLLSSLMLPFEVLFEDK